MSTPYCTRNLRNTLLYCCCVRTFKCFNFGRILCQTASIPDSVIALLMPKKKVITRPHSYIPLNVAPDNGCIAKAHIGDSDTHYNKVCIHYIQGSCSYADACRYHHPTCSEKHRELLKTQQCNRGPDCPFQAQGTCLYSHRHERIQGLKLKLSLE